MPKTLKISGESKVVYKKTVTLSDSLYDELLGRLAEEPVGEVLMEFMDRQHDACDEYTDDDDFAVTDEAGRDILRGIGK